MCRVTFVNSFLQKCTSKNRRDVINDTLLQMRDTLPLTYDVSQRISQLQTMSLACVRLRKARYFAKCKRLILAISHWIKFEYVYRELWLSIVVIELFNLCITRMISVLSHSYESLNNLSCPMSTSSVCKVHILLYITSLTLVFYFPRCVSFVT